MSNAHDESQTKLKPQGLRVRVPEPDMRMEKAQAKAEQGELRRSQAGQAISSEAGMSASELKYRRLFESARDGILILDGDTGRITDANPLLVELLGYSRPYILGKTVGELSPFKDIIASEAMMERLQTDRDVRYEHLPLETSNGRHSDAEFERRKPVTVQVVAEQARRAVRAASSGAICFSPIALNCPRTPRRGVPT